MPVGYIAAAKELSPVTYQPLILVEFEFYNYGAIPNQTAYFSSHMLSAVADGGGGNQYDGNDYLPRILNTEDLATSLMSEQGIDAPPSISVVLADPDGALWSTYELPTGWKGATVTVRFVLWDAGTSDFSTDSIVMFRGVCSQAEVLNDSTIRVTAVSKLQMTQVMVPGMQLQPSCMWSFPMTAAQRQSAADDDSSPCYECGYAPDATGSNVAGNYQAETTLSGGINSSQTTITVGSVIGSLPPVPFPAVIVRTGDNETVIVTEVDGSDWTVVRGAQGTIGVSSTSGWAVVVPFVSCDKTRTACMQRMGKVSDTSLAPDGNLSMDNASRPTGRYSGIMFKPPSTLAVRPYISGKWEQVVNNSNQAKYGDLVPLNYGTTWINGLVLFSTGDGNYTTMDVLVSYGQIPWVYDVIVNGTKIPHTYNDGRLSAVPAEITNNSKQSTAGGWWTTYNDGRRNGRIVSDRPWNGKGDPYGSLAVLSITVPSSLAAPSSTPTVQVLLDGPAVRVYSDSTTYTREYSSNPAWVMLDQLIWAGWQESELDIQSFIDAAAKFDTQIEYMSQTGSVVDEHSSPRPGGGTVPYAKHDVSLTLRTRTSAADVLRGLRNGCKSILVPDRASGKLQLVVKESLASQQPAPIELNGEVATNYLTAIPSITVGGESADGYVAYDFDESNIAFREGSNESTFRILPRSLAESPNSLSVSFQNFENKYNTDSLLLVEAEDQLRISSQPIVSGPPVYGPNSFDRSRRALATMQAEFLRGNPRNAVDGQSIGDTGGTYAVEFETSFRAIHLRVGDIIRITFRQRNIIGWLFRVAGVVPGLNARRLRIVASYHNDAWYMDTFGQVNAPEYRIPQGNNARPPYAWAPYGEQPMPGNSIYPPSEWNFRISQYFTLARDNTAIGRGRILGRKPVTATVPSPLPPIVALQATSATTGGTIPGGRNYFYLVCSKSAPGSDYQLSDVSLVLAQVYVPATTNTNAVALPVTYWDPSAPGYVVFGGISPQKLTYQTDADFTPGSGPATITLTAYTESGWPAPDSAFDHLRIHHTRGWNLGVAGTTLKSCTSSTIELAVNAAQGFGLATNQFQNYDISLAGLVRETAGLLPSAAPIPIWDAKIASNTADTITLGAGLDGNVPDPTSVPRGDGTFGLIEGDALVIRTRPTAGSDADGNYLEDANWVHTMGDFLEPLAITAVTNANPAEVTTSQDHGYATGDKVFIDHLQGMSGYSPTLCTITVTGTDTFTIGVDTTSAGTYSGTGGVARKLQRGMVPDVRKGFDLLFIAGTLRGSMFTIKKNSVTKLWIVGDWPNGVVPDSTSRYIILDPSWHTKDSARTVNTEPATEIQAEFELENFNRTGMVALVTTVNAAGQESLLFNSPVRDFFAMGDPGNLVFAGSMAIQVDGVLAIGSDLGPRSFFNTDVTLKAVRLAVKQAPVDDDIIVKIYTDTNDLIELTIPDGQTSVDASAAEIAAMAQILAQQNVKVDILSVGTTFGGASLSVGLFY